jgi:hypothetical protein
VEGEGREPGCGVWGVGCGVWGVGCGGWGVEGGGWRVDGSPGRGRQGEAGGGRRTQVHTEYVWTTQLTS